MEEPANTKQARAVTQKKEQNEKKPNENKVVYKALEDLWIRKESNEMVNTQGRQNGPEETTENMPG